MKIVPTSSAVGANSGRRRAPIHRRARTSSSSEAAASAISTGSAGSSRRAPSCSPPASLLRLSPTIAIVVSSANSHAWRHRGCHGDASRPYSAIGVTLNRPISVRPLISTRIRHASHSSATPRPTRSTSDGHPRSTRCGTSAAAAASDGKRIHGPGSRLTSPIRNFWTFAQRSGAAFWNVTSGSHVLDSHRFVTHHTASTAIAAPMYQAASSARTFRPSRSHRPGRALIASPTVATVR